MKLRIKTLRRVIREALKQINNVDEADLDPNLDPSNNPGRPDDAYDYLGMHPSPEMAMAHPAAGGGSTSLGSDSSGEVSGDEEPTPEVTR